MINSKQTILLIVPEFPPNGSMGGRRWAKFAKYLAKNGFLLKVIAFQPSSKKAKANWLSDIQDANIEVYYLPSHYPAILNSTSSNILTRVFKKIANIIVSAYDGGIIQDKSIFFKKTLIDNASEIIKKFNIKNVVTTGPYHRACYYTVLLKENFPDLNVIVDFRDRWTDGQVYGIKNLAHSKFVKEEKLQKYTCENADFILSTYSEIIRELKSEYPKIQQEKFLHLPHNFDLDDYAGLSIEGKPLSVKEKISFLYGGTVNTAAFEDAFSPFFYALKDLKSKNKSLFDRINVEIYGENFMLAKLVEELNIKECVKISSQLSEKEFYTLASKCDFLLMFLGNEWKDLMTTKNITYLPFRKPFVLISKAGEVSEMIENNKIGFLLEPSVCYEKLVNLIQNYDAGQLQYNYNFDFSNYSYKDATERLIKLFK